MKTGFSQYRSNSLKRLWSRVKKELGLERIAVGAIEEFSTWEVDDICANNWRPDNPVEVCVGVLLEYIDDIVDK